MRIPKYSIIIPVYNRPHEVDELLQSLCMQTLRDFEVLLIEDGSVNRCDTIAEKYSDKLPITYYYKPNTGQGFSRNFGYQKARGDYFIVFDSDCIIPSHYLKTVDDFLKHHPVDAFGGPDKSLPNFTRIQQAISYSMTSFFTTGGIRGGEKRIGEFHPRSFNMGISRKVFEATGGYKITRMGEDIEFSIRIIKSGFSTALIPEAYVYHKRRTDLGQFYKQLHFFGRARINIGRFYPREVKAVHCFPAAFVAGVFLLCLMPFINFIWFAVLGCFFSVYFLLIFIDALISTRNIAVSILSLASSFIQLFAYGVGFIQEGVRFLRLRSS